MLLCADEMLAVVEDPDRFLREELGKILALKENSIDSPGYHLRSKGSQEMI